MLVLAVGCGQSGPVVNQVRLGDATIIWAGNIDDSAEYHPEFVRVVQCLEENGFSTGVRPPYTLFVLSDSFKCGAQLNERGCYDPSYNAVYITRKNVSEDHLILSHETLHWAGYHDHNDPPFGLCTSGPLVRGEP